MQREESPGNEENNNVNIVMTQWGLERTTEEPDELYDWLSVVYLRSSFDKLPRRKQKENKAKGKGKRGRFVSVRRMMRLRRPWICLRGETETVKRKEEGRWL